jgi:ATP-dependent DNA helicase PIF1
MNNSHIHIERNEQFQSALDCMEQTTKNVFVTGKAGTGKSTLLTYFRSTTKKNIVVLAPTGVAALNIKGQTIHSFFHFQPNITVDTVKKRFSKDSKKSVYKLLDVIVIDEVSMVRADLLDCIDRFMRLNGKTRSLPFGGAQMIFIGDLYQLPPVVTGAERELFRTHYKSQYFFDAHMFSDFSMEFIELEKHYRQTDQKFISLLNAVRNNGITEQQLEEINSRYDPMFSPDTTNLFISLTTTNKLADEINQMQLAKLNTKIYAYAAFTQGQFDQSIHPADRNLVVKVGSQVMMLSNDQEGRWVNGSIGKIIKISHNEDMGDILTVKLSEGITVTVTMHTWELFQFSYDQKENKLVSKTVGTFTQYPLMLSWAVTVHKSQGKTFDHVIIDIGNGTFVHGQMYVALSRCTTLGGIILKKKFEKKHIFMDWRVVQFVTAYQYKKSEEQMSLVDKIQMIQQAIETEKKLALVYLKANDEKSQRILLPSFVGEMAYRGKTFLGVCGFDSKKGGERNFRVERILEMWVEE